MAAHQPPPSLGFSRQEHWSGLTFPSPMHESESEVAQSYPTLSDPMDCSLPGSSVHGILQARVPEWGAIALSGMNNALTEIKNILEGSNSRITEAEDRISEVEDRIVEISEAERKKRFKGNEDNLRDLWDNVKCPNIQIIGVPEEEDKKEDHEKILEEIIVENFP